MKKSTLLFPVALASFAISGYGQIVFSETFDSNTLANTRSGAAGVNGVTYNGGESWQVASNGPAGANETSWAVGTGLGWTANDGGGNQYLFSDSIGSAAGSDSSAFRSFGWNANSDEILTINFSFAVRPEDDGLGGGNTNWGAFIMSSNSGLGSNVETVAGSGDQQLHIRFDKDGNVTYQDNTLIGSGGEFTTGLDATNTLSIIYNGSNSAYTGISSGNASLTVNGSLVDGNFDIGHVSNVSGPVILDYMEFRSFGGLDDQSNIPFQAYFDDVGVTAVPEPATIALLIGIGALGVVLSRRRVRNQ